MRLSIYFATKHYGDIDPQMMEEEIPSIFRRASSCRRDSPHLWLVISHQGAGGGHGLSGWGENTNKKMGKNWEKKSCGYLVIENLTSDIAPKVFFGHHLNVYLIALIWAKSPGRWSVRATVTRFMFAELMGLKRVSPIWEVLCIKHRHQCAIVFPAKNDDSD